MGHPPSIAESVFRLSDRIDVLPILHGNGDVAQEVRERLISRPYDCLAVPLPPSLEDRVEQAVDALPAVSVAVLPEAAEAGGESVTFVPIDPCQPVIMGIRVAMGEGIARAYVDREVSVFDAVPFQAPDAYAVKRTSLPAFAAALIPFLPAPPHASQQAKRVAWTAFRLHELELDFRRILCLSHVADWPWLREAYRSRSAYDPPDPRPGIADVFRVDADTLYFALGELPFVTECYERRRAELRSDRHVSIDGIKELLLESRSRWMDRHAVDKGSVPNWVTPQLLQLFLLYVRNLTLLDRRLAPDLYTLVLAAKQTAGDDFAVTLLETAKRYSFQDETEPGLYPTASVGIGRVELPDGRLVTAKNRLQGPPLVWRSLSLRPKPDRWRSRRWSYLWNPYRQCSWPPEDQKIESFNAHVRARARALLGADLARVEKFTTSIKDGVDLRETLRHWHERRATRRIGPVGVKAPMDIYVKEIPPARGNVDAVVFLFDTPADPALYSWRATWYAEHQEESTLCFYATPFLDRMVGPGIGQSRYGGALFLYPPRVIPDVWSDPALEVAATLEERLIAAAAAHSREPHVALVSPIPPPARWRRLARRWGRRLVVIPLGRFSGQTVDRLRSFHVLNGHEIRSYAAQFIR